MPATHLSQVVDTSEQVAGEGGRNAKVQLLAALLKRLEPDEVAPAVALLSGVLRQGRIGLGPAAFKAANPGAAALEPQLTIREIDRAFDAIAAIGGKGSTARRKEAVAALLARATKREQAFLVRLVLGGLRQGAMEGLMVTAVAKAVGAKVKEVRRAAMLAGSLVEVADKALVEGKEALSTFGVKLFQPLQPMLAQPADDVSAVFERMDAAAIEWKLDGARIQVHKSDDEVRVYTRRLKDVTRSVPEVVELAKSLPARELILDGEVIALRDDARPHPFQVTMRRFGRKLDVAAMRAKLPLTPFFFDLLHLDGESVLDAPLSARHEALEAALGDPALLVPRRLADNEDDADAFVAEAIEAGHEGAMAKALDASYEAGGRGFSWLKLKPVHTLDLVVIAAEWGHGRRSGWLSNLHLAARDPSDERYVMLGKTFKGMTDETLAWQTQRLQALSLGQEGITVHVEPSLVAEIAFNDLQESPHYPGGLALRFARLVRYREDKTPQQAATIDEVRAVYSAQTK